MIFLEHFKTQFVLQNSDQRYLWIDSLYIIQDDEEDWAREAAAMAKIYSGSLCTLAALSSRDGAGGCYVEHSAQSTLGRFLDVDFGLRRVRIFEEEPTDWYNEYDDDPYRHGRYGVNPLRERVSTLQERELSIRNIHLPRSMLL